MFDFTFSIPTPATFAFRFTTITRHWWANHGGKEASQELLLAIVLSMAAIYFYYVQLAITATVAVARFVREYAPLVAQMIAAGGYAVWVVSEPQRQQLLAAIVAYDIEADILLLLEHWGNSAHGVVRFAVGRY